MILLDVNVVVYAVRREFEHHRIARSWLAQTLVSDEPVGVLDEVLCATVRLLTNRRVVRTPLTIEQATRLCDQVRAAPAAVVPASSPKRWERFTGIVTGLGLRGNDVPDAFLAATALDLRAGVATFDRGFHRFPGLRVVRPGD